MTGICGTPKIMEAARELADLIAQVVDGTGIRETERKRYTRGKPVRRGHKRGPYAKKAVAA